MPARALRDRVIDIEDPKTDSARGRGLRKQAPRASLAELVVGPRTATEILVEQNANRLPELVPIRFARMLTDPFAFLRGSAAVMAADLASGPSSAIHVVSCGDAHIANFGLYAAPDRALVFDLNDFDEAAFAPWEWDVKRLITSAIVGARHAGYPATIIRRVADRGAQAYQDAMHEIVQMNLLDRYYLRCEPRLYRKQMRKTSRSVVEAAMRRAHTRTSAQAFDRMVAIGDDGVPRLREIPPLLKHIDVDLEKQLVAALGEYLTAVPVDIAVLLAHFTVTDLALRVVGVGSVGTRCYLSILVGPEGTPLVLQIKEANQSVLEQYGGIEQPKNLRAAVDAQGQGIRVIDGQRVLQAMSDVFLGPTRHDGRDYYIRQFRDMKGSLDIQEMSPSGFGDYVAACALLLARAHVQSANAAMLSGYVGKNASVRKAVVEWCFSYADKSLDDFHQLRAAAKSGQIPVADDALL